MATSSGYRLQADPACGVAGAAAALTDPAVNSVPHSHRALSATRS